MIRSLLPACAAAASLLMASPAPDVNPWKNAGPFSVATLEMELAQTGREFPLEIRIRLPKGATGALPLVVFSHGAGGDRTAFPELCAHWASHGYVVVNPTHSDSVRLRRQRGERFGLDVRRDPSQVVAGVSLPQRRADIQLVLDSLADIEKRASVKIDRDRIAMAGHSAGAMTTQMEAGVKFYARAGGRGMSAPEPRFCAFVVISGQGLGRPAFRKESWSGITAPLFVIGGSADRSPVSDDAPEARKDPYLYAASARKYLMFIEGATHGSYAGKSVVRVLGEKPPANLDYITGVVAAGTTAFLDSTLKRDPAAARFLDSEALPNLPGGKMEYRHP